MRRKIGLAIAAMAVLTGCDAAGDNPSGGSHPDAVPELAVAEASDANNSFAVDAAPERASPAPPQVAVSCADGEETVFSCKTKSGNDLAVCLSLIHI